MSIETVPYVSVQPDWDQVVKDVTSQTVAAEKFWISFYCTGKESVHHKVTVTTSTLEAEGDFSVQRVNSRAMKVECPVLGIPSTTVLAPRSQFSIKHRAECLDVSPSGELYAIGRGAEIDMGKLIDGENQRLLKGHVSDVNVVQFFPSNLVLLSGGADFQLKIWSLIDGSNPVTLKGHTSAVTDTAIISRGRNILSSSRDGTIRLWNCGTADTIAVVGSYNCSVSKILLAKLPKHIEPADPKALDEREVDTADCMVIAALADGSARFIHLGTKQELFSATGDDVPLTCIAYDAETEVLVTGDRQGVVRVFCLSELNAPVVAWQRNEHAVTDIQLKPDEEGSSTLCVANADGSIYQTGSLDAILEKKKVQVLAEYSGNELENVRGLRVMASPAGQSRLVSTIETGQICLY